MFLLFLCFLVVFSRTLAGQNPEWVQSAGGSRSDYVLGITSDPEGNVFSTGYFSSPSFHAGEFSVSNVQSRTNDIYLAKYDPAGRILWLRSAGGTENDYGHGIGTDALGNVYVTGNFSSPQISFGSFTLRNAGSWDIFLVKYNSGGDVLWAKSAGGKGEDLVSGFLLGKNESIYLAGYYNSEIFPAGNLLLPDSGGTDIFLAKISLSGDFYWLTRAGGKSNEYVMGLAGDPEDNIYITGSFMSPVLPFGKDTRRTKGSWDMFLSKFSAGGNELWAVQAGGSGSDAGHSLFSDEEGNLYVSCTFLSLSVTYTSRPDPQPLSQTGDNYLIRYDALGSIQWTKLLSQNSGDIISGLTVTPSGDIFTVGTVRRRLNAKTAASDLDIQFVRYNPEGNKTWSGTMHGSGADHAYCVQHDSSGNVYVAGTFSGNFLDTGIAELSNNGEADIYLTKLLAR